MTILELTLTNPIAINWSASRREQIPAFERNLFKRVPTNQVYLELRVDIWKFVVQLSYFNIKYISNNSTIILKLKDSLLKLRFLSRLTKESKEYTNR